MDATCISYWGWDAREMVSLATVANLAWKIVATGDFDGDGIADLLWRNSDSGRNAIWRSAYAATQIQITTVPNLAWKIAAVGTSMVMGVPTSSGEMPALAPM